MKTVQDKFRGCIIAGAIGDAWGSSYEGEIIKLDSTTFYWGKPKQPAIRQWAITDDTQLTLATCEALSSSQPFSPELLARYFVNYYKQKKLTGIGASTLKAIKELEVGGHWSQVGRTGEYAAGNGAAMRIVPLAFYPYISREILRDVCRITHRNDEAYVGALAVFLSIRLVLNNAWNGDDNLINQLIPELPDTRVRDRLIEINAIKNHSSIVDIAMLGNDGYVVNSVPFAIFSAMQVMKIGFTEMLSQVIEAGGDTDTNASIAGQIAGTLLGINAIPDELISKLQQVNNYDWIRKITDKTAIKVDSYY